MEIINALESRERGIYCGVLGVISRDSRKKRNFIDSHKNSSDSRKNTQNLKATFSVPIRTMWKNSNESFWRFGVGSGVVWDSQCEAEIDELKLKSAFLFRKDFALIETILARGNMAFLFSAHINRMRKSAHSLGFKAHIIDRFAREPKISKTIKNFLHFDILKQDFEALPRVICEAIKARNEYYILRLKLNRAGNLSAEILPFFKQKREIYHAKFAKTRIDSHNDALYNKSTLRAHFKKVPDFSRDKKLFDYIYCNENGAVCEGSRSNIVILKNGALFTPDAGRLQGVMLGYFGNLITPKTLTKRDLKNADKIFCINSVRGVVEVKIKG